MTIRIGLIGAGRMGLTHSSNLKDSPDVCLSGVYDPDAAKVASYVEKYGARSFSDPVSLCASQEVDFIVICSPTYVHMEGLMAALPTGKPIFCEKPLCRTLAETEVLSPLLRSYTGLFGVGFVRRYSASVRRGKELVDSGILGRILCSEVRNMFGKFSRLKGDWFTDYRLSGGCGLDMLAHHIDLQHYFLGRAESVYAQGLMLDESQDLPSDFISMTATYRSGCISSLSSSWLRNGPSVNSMTLYGEKAAMTISDSEGLVLHKDGKDEIVPLDDVCIIENVQDDPNGDMYKNEMDCMIEAIKSGKHTVPAGVEAALDAMDFIMAALQSCETGESVRL